MASTAKELEQALLDRSRNKVVIGLMMILSCPSYDPTTEGPALLKVVDEVAKTGALAMLGLGVNLFGTNATGIQTDRNLDEELRTLIRTLFPLGFDVDGQEDPPGDIYAEAAKGVYDAPLNEGDRVTGKPEALGAPYTEQQFSTDCMSILSYARGAGVNMSDAKKVELETTLRAVLETGKPMTFEPGNGDVLVLGAKAGSEAEFTEFATAAGREHRIRALLKRLGLGPVT